MSKKFESYGAISPIYDKINKDVDYVRWADFFEECFKRYLGEKPCLVLDLACGTGSMTLELASRGYDMIGIDLSSDMLGIAYERKFDAELENDVLFLCQDMREFELYGTVGAISCCLDSVNYLTGDGELDKCFSLAHNYLDPDGLFLFDVNTPYKFENVYAQNSYVYDEEDCDGDSFCIWQNFYDKDTRICDFSLTVFEREKGGERYLRSDEQQSERCYSLEEISAALENNGFELLGVFSDFEFTPAEDAPRSERWYFAARAKK